MKLMQTVCLSAIFFLLQGCSVLSGINPWEAPFPKTVKQLENQKPKSREIEIQKWTTSQGSKVMFMQAREIPMVEMRLLFDGGSARDGDLPGLAKLTSAMIGEGTENKNVEEILQGFDRLGAEFSTSSYTDMAIVDLTSLSDSHYLEPAINLVQEVLSEPVWPQASLDRIRAQMMQTLKMKKEVPGPQLADKWDALLFGDHPYSIIAEGTEESLPAINKQSISDFYSRYYTSANMVIAIVGDVTRKQAEAMAEKISQSLPQGEPAEEFARVKKHHQRQRVHVEFPSSQTSIIIGNQSVWRGHPDYVPLYVGNMVLGGGGFASILTEEVRQKRGLVYGIHSGFALSRYAGQFEVGLQTANKNADTALSLTLKLVEDFVRDGPSQQQVQAAVDNITGSFALGTASNSSIIGYLGMMGFYDLPLDYLDWFQQQVVQVTPEDIQQAFQRNLNPDHLLIGSAGPRAPQIIELEQDEKTQP